MITLTRTRRSSTIIFTGTTNITDTRTKPRRRLVNRTRTVTRIRRYVIDTGTTRIYITGTATEDRRDYVRLFGESAVARPRPMYIVPGIQRRVSATPRRARSHCAALPAVTA